jgi:F-type H+-transporting ATPase subunit a
VEGNPILHSNDGDILFLPFGASIDLFQYTLMSRFMFLNLVAAILVATAFLAYVGVQRRYGYAKGGFFNALEALLVYVRNDIAVPSIGKKDADRFLPLLWTLFFFILVGNLLGMLPWLGSPTGALGTTSALALCVFITVHAWGIKENGLGHYIESFVPPVPNWVKPILIPIEILSHLLRPLILAFRLFVNMLAGHTVLFVFISFILAASKMAPGLLPPTITFGSVAANVALSFLELLVAFIQAYVFTFLTALYIGGALHPHH